MFKFFLRADCLLSAIVEAPNEEVGYTSNSRLANTAATPSRT